jgi:hypothetical protein
VGSAVFDTIPPLAFSIGDVVTAGAFDAAHVGPTHRCGLMFNFPSVFLGPKLLLGAAPFVRSRSLRRHSAKSYENPAHGTASRNTDDFPVPVTAALIGGFSAGHARYDFGRNEPRALDRPTPRLERRAPTSQWLRKQRPLCSTCVHFALGL